MPRDLVSESSVPMPQTPQQHDRPLPPGQEVQRFVESLSNEEKMLIVLQKELYERSWQAMLDDLNNRLEGRPYIFKLANRIKDDIARILKLAEFEKKHQVALADYITQMPE